jgi:hypothetical protein
VQLYRYFVSQSSEFRRHNPLCCFSTSVHCCKRVFRNRLSPETFGYILVCPLFLRRAPVTNMEKSYGNVPRILTSVLYASQCIASRSGPLYRWEKRPTYTMDWMDPRRDGVEDSEELILHPPDPVIQSLVTFLIAGISECKSK